MPFIRFLATILLFAAPALAQDPVKVAPQAYKLDFENDWVKVLRVHYAAKEKIPEHDHPATAAALARSASLWERRIAIIATLHWIRRARRTFCASATA
jgi:hypothetical protein